METILIWLGSGFAFAVGICIGAFFMRSLSKGPSKEMSDEATQLLRERNEIGQRQVKAIEALVYAANKSNDMSENK